MFTFSLLYFYLHKEKQKKKTLFNIYNNRKLDKLEFLAK